MKSPQFVGIDHVQMLCPIGGEEHARAYWTGVVGLSEVEKPQELKARGGAWFSCGAQGLHIGAEDGFSPATRAHAALRVASGADLDALVSRLQSAGYEVTIAEPPVAERRIKTHDPFGNLVEFVVGSTG